MNVQMILILRYRVGTRVGTRTMVGSSAAMVDAMVAVPSLQKRYHSAAPLSRVFRSMGGVRGRGERMLR